MEHNIAVDIHLEQILSPSEVLLVVDKVRALAVRAGVLVAHLVQGGGENFGSTEEHAHTGAGEHDNMTTS